MPFTAQDLIVAPARSAAPSITLRRRVRGRRRCPRSRAQHGVRPARRRATIRASARAAHHFPSAAAMSIHRLEDIAALKAAHPHGLVVAHTRATRSDRRWASAGSIPTRPLWDAIEVNALHVRGVDWNRATIAWAAARGRPDRRQRRRASALQLGLTWSEVDVDLPPWMSDTEAANAICEAIRAGQVRVVGRLLSPWKAASIFAQMEFGGLRGRCAAWPPSRLVGRPAFLVACPMHIPLLPDGDADCRRLSRHDPSSSAAGAEPRRRRRSRRPRPPRSHPARRPRPTSMPCARATSPRSIRRSPRRRGRHAVSLQPHRALVRRRPRPRRGRAAAAGEGRDADATDSFYNQSSLGWASQPAQARRPEHAEVVKLLLEKGAEGPRARSWRRHRQRRCARWSR